MRLVAPCGTEAPLSIRVLIADDEPPLLRMVADLIRAYDGFEVAALAADADEAAERAAETRPDVALLDVRMPGGGVSAARAIRSRSPRTHIVAHSAYHDTTLVLAMLRAGATGYVVKGAPPERADRGPRGRRQRHDDALRRGHQRDGRRAVRPAPREPADGCRARAPAPRDPGRDRPQHAPERPAADLRPRAARAGGVRGARAVPQPLDPAGARLVLGCGHRRPAGRARADGGRDRDGRAGVAARATPSSR